MCLFTTQKEIDDFKEKHKDKITAYKFLTVKDKRLFSYYFHMYQWFIGQNKCEKRVASKFEVFEKDVFVVNEGIHVYLDKQHAIGDMNAEIAFGDAAKNSLVLVEVLCDMKHFIAAGSQSWTKSKAPYVKPGTHLAVFSEVTLSQQEYNKHTI